MKALFLRIGSVIAILAISTAISAFESEIKIDGVNNREWGGRGDAHFDVNPDSVASIDILTAECMDFYQLTEGRDAQLYFGIKFLGAPLGDSVETSYEIFIDRFPDNDTEGIDGEKMEPWIDFYPDYRFKVTGKNGRIESTLYTYWDGSSWVKGDPSAIAAAVGVNTNPSGHGTYGLLEVGLSWESVGPPPSLTVPSTRLEWAIIASQGRSQDYFPDLDKVYPYGHAAQYYPGFLSVKPSMWGRIKSLYR